MEQNPMGLGPEPGREEEQVTPLDPTELATMSSTAKIAYAAQALAQMGVEADAMSAGELAEEINRRSGVGHEAASVVALSTRPIFPVENQ